MLVLKRGDCYGYEIAQNIRENTDGVISIKEGTMYPILWKMLEEKKIASYDKVFNGRNRVYYHIEEEGIAYLEELIHDFMLNTGKIQNFIKFVEGEHL